MTRQEIRLTRAQFSRSLWRAIVPPLLLLALNAGIIATLLIWTLDTGDRARLTDELIARTNDVERHLANMETGFRGYKLTGQEEFLRPHRQARTQIEGTLADLKSMLAQSQRQRERVQRIESLFLQWLRLEPEVGAPLTQVTPEEISAMTARRLLMEDMRRAVNEMLLAATENQATENGRAASAATIALFGSVGLNVLMGLALALINRRTVVELSGQYQRVLDDEALRSAELESSRRQFLDLVETVPQLVFVVDGEGRVSYLNQRWISYTGQSAPPPEPGGWTAAVHPDDRALAAARWREAQQSGKPFEGEFRLRRQMDGAFRHFLCRATAVIDAQGRRTQWFGTCTDIETQKQVEREREALLAAERAARSDLLRISQAKDEFLATLSHELRTPMTAIMGWSRLLRDPAVRDKSLDRAIDAIDTNARAQARLIEDLLDMSRIISGKLTIKPEPLDTRQIVRAAAESIGPAVAAKKITLHVEIDESADLTIQGDSARLQQVVGNLLSNAVKFTPPGGRIDVRLEPDEDGEQFALLTVRDDGQGIKPSFLPYVFERFRQADGSTTRQHGGLGLGLAIARHLVESHGGQISAESGGPGKGATFVVRLPLRPPHLLATAGANLPAPWLASSVRLDGARVLTVEDDPDTALIVQTILERVGAQVVAASGGEDALQLLRQREGEGRFDLLISDIGMPGMDGYGLLRRLREMEAAEGARRLPAIALSAFARDEDRRAALTAGYDRHIAKPIAVDELLLAAGELVSALPAGGRNHHRDNRGGNGDGGLPGRVRGVAEEQPADRAKGDA